MAPSKTARMPAAPSKTAKTPQAKKTTVPNASILSFFKKTPRPDDSMFVGDAYRPSGGLGGHEKDDEPYKDDLYDDEEPVDARYESQTPTKRRKLNGAGDLQERSPDRSPRGPPDDAASIVRAAGRERRPRQGPFLDDSEDDEEPGPNTSEDTSAPKPDDDNGTPAARVDTRTFPGVPPSGARGDTAPRSPSQDLLTDGPNGWDGWDDTAYPDDEDQEEGEESRERRFQEEQAQWDDAEDPPFDSGDEAPPGGSTASCPLCGAGLDGVGAEDANVHVNQCLDGIPVPPEWRRSAEEEESSPQSHPEIAGPELSKRFARAARPRPGQADPFALGPAAPGSGSAFARLMSGHAEDAAWATAAAVENASRGMPAYRRTCPFYKIMPGFSVCVDAFRYGAVEGCRAYFLSHFHSDHYIGLTASWCHGPIYCSRVTASLVRSQLRTADRWVVELDFEETVEVPDTQGVRVTMIPANHCPGSSLFLFEKKNGPDPGRGASGTQRILHCGDFRACAAHVEHPLLRPETRDAVTGKARQQKIDVCYLDTTYLNPRYSFPPQEDVVSACAALCVSLHRATEAGDDAPWEALLRRRPGDGAAGTASVSHFFAKDAGTTKSPQPAAAHDDALSALGKKPPRLLVVCGTYSIGKERICKAIALALKTKIFASPSKMRIVRQLGDPELAALMTSDPREAQVHMQILMEMRAETLADYLASYRPHFTRVVGLRPSGWNFRPQGPAAGRAGAQLAPGSLPTTQLLHGPAWKTAFAARDMAPQRGSTREAVCLGVPYSEHSSFRELALFVLSLRIERIVPTVNVGSDVSRKRMKGWLDRWIAERRRGGVARVLERVGDGPDSKAAGKGVGGEVGRRGMWDGKDGHGGGVFW